MGTYIGKVQMGNDNTNLIALGDTLYGTCNIPASTADKVVTLPEFDRVIQGVQVRVRFNNGNTVTSNVRLKFSNISPETFYPVVGDCTCGQNDVISFTYENDSSNNSYFRVTNTGLSQTFKDYVASQLSTVISGADAMVFKGTIGTGGNPGTLPSSGYKAGWTYKVITEGTYATAKCEVGDMIIATTNATDGQSEVVPAHWTVIQTNIDGAVTGPTVAQGDTINNHVAIFDQNTGKVIKDSGFTIETSVPSGAVFTDTNTSYKYTISNSNTGTAAFTAAGAYDSTQANSTLLASVSNGVLILAEGITFTTTAMTSASLTESAVAGPTVSSGT